LKRQEKIPAKLGKKKKGEGMYKVNGPVKQHSGKKRPGHPQRRRGEKGIGHIRGEAGLTGGKSIGREIASGRKRVSIRAIEKNRRMGILEGGNGAGSHTEIAFHISWKGNPS